MKNKRLAEETAKELEEAKAAPELGAVRELGLERELCKRLAKESSELRKAYLLAKEVKKKQASGYKKEEAKYKAEVRGCNLVVGEIKG